MKKNILILDDYKPLKKIFIKKLKKYSLTFKNLRKNQNLLKYLKNKKFYAIYTAFGYKLNQEILQSNQNDLKYLISPTTGTDHIDLNFCKKNKIKVLTLKNEKNFLKNICATAELTWTLILALAKNLNNFSNDVIYRHNWHRNKYLNNDLRGSSLGIIGYGRIGRILIKYAKAFGMKIFIYEKERKKIKSSKNFKFVSLKKIFDCKFITIHIPLEGNHNFFSKKVLKHLKKSSYLINTSRGDIFNEQHLINLMKSKSVKGFGFDVLPSDVVWKNKIPSKYNFLKKLKGNFYVTPHIGGNSIESRIKTTLYMIQKFQKNQKTKG
tara:strand:- start:603 stop:1571 length:969 start_codon:yes stop_codon:yes gene_type:complete